MKRISTLSILLCVSILAWAGESLLGWACYEGLGLAGTYGGMTGKTVHVDNREDLARYAMMEEPLTIVIDKDLSGAGLDDRKDFIYIGSDKTIVGAGDGILLNGLGLELQGQSNVIIRNLTITKAKPDGLALRNCHHIWVDHSDFSSADDGLLDLTLGSDFMTVSWCRFHHHNKVSLANSGTGHSEDIGKERVTYHHNWYYDAVQRNPRVGYGKGHVFNNLYTRISSYCVGFFCRAEVLVENNSFHESAASVRQMYNDYPGSAYYGLCLTRGNLYDRTPSKEYQDDVFDPEDFYSYRFALDPAEQVEQKVLAFSGPQPGIAEDLILYPGDGTLDYQASRLMWSKTGEEQKWILSWGTDKENLQNQEIEDAFCELPLDAATTYFWQVKALMKDGSTRVSQLNRLSTAPAQASRPMPADGSKNAALYVGAQRYSLSAAPLTWTPARGAVKEQVYVGTTRKLTAANLVQDSDQSVFWPETGWDFNRTYYWKVVSQLADGSRVESPVWSFSSQLPALKPGLTECETMALSGRAFQELVDSKWFQPSQGLVAMAESGMGLISGVWAGKKGEYRISVTYFDEKDGRSQWRLLVNGEEADAWRGDLDNEQLVSHQCPTVSLKPGDVISLEIVQQRGEQARTDCISIESVK